MDSTLEFEFPDAGLLPKDATQADEVIAANPEWDGRGIIVAILDTGVDPGAPGLAETSDGRRKIVDIVEATGSGDVEMTTSVTATAAESESVTITGLSGRTLKLNPSWANPSGVWKLGIKPGFEFFPGGLTKRWKENEDLEASFSHLELETNVRRRLAQWDSENPTPSPAKFKEREELDKQLQGLKGLQKSFTERGPIYDVVAFHDGTVWRAALDASQAGDLTTAEALTNYRDEPKYLTLSSGTSLNYCLNIYDDGAVVSVVCDTGSHGTHVAGIVAGYNKEHPELNGIAPGAQIVSIKIGDSRLGSMETGVGLTRAMRAIVDNGCHLANMSYGEPTSVPNSGRFVELLARLNRRHNVIFVASAGNNGPALSTVGAPGGTAASVIGVGAMVTTSLAGAGYGLVNPSHPTLYTWSSRGPAADGSLGVSITAPGGAIAPIPNWTLGARQLMNGTSMSSPNACGNFALILSALKAQGKSWTPYAVRRAVENTAVPVDGSDVFGLGCGLMQTASALAKLNESDLSLRGFAIKVPNQGVGAGAQTDRGVYWRDASRAATATHVSVSITPLFEDEEHESFAKGNEDKDNDVKLAFEMRVGLVSTAPEWVKPASSVYVNSTGGAFSVLVDPRKLATGSANFAEVLGFDVANPGAGPLFRIPVTVIKPLEAVNDGISCGLVLASPSDPISLREATITRHFVSVPRGSEWVDVSVTRVDGGEQGTSLSAREVDSPRTIVVHLVQTLAHTSLKKSSTEEYFAMLPGQTNNLSFSVVPDATLEVVVAQYWSSQGDTQIAAQLEFRGMHSATPQITYGAADGFVKFRVSPYLHDVLLSPSASLTHAELSLQPESAVIAPLLSRDMLISKRQQYALNLTYKFTTDANGSVTFTASKLHNVLYESCFDAQFLIISDGNKRAVGKSDTFPENINLDKGTYSIRLQARHDSVDALESLKIMPLVVRKKLSSEIALTVYGDRSSAVLGGAAYSKRRVKRNDVETLFLGLPAQPSLPKEFANGDILTGSLSLTDYGKTVFGSAKAPDGYPVRYVLTKCASPSSGAPKAVPVPETPKSAADKLKDAIIDIKLNHLKGLKGDEFQGLYQDLVSVVGDRDLKLLTAKLQAVDSSWETSDPVEITAAVDAVLQAADLDAVAAYFGLRRDIEGEENADVLSEHKQFTERKNAIIDALFRKTRSLCTKVRELRSSHGASESKCDGGRHAGDSGSVASDSSSVEGGYHDGFHSALKQLKQLVDLSPSTSPHQVVLLEHDLRKGRFGAALVRVQAILGGNETTPSCGLSVPVLHDIRVKLCEALGWNLWAARLAKQRLLTFPLSEMPF